MAYPIVCVPCLDEQHDACLEWSKVPPPQDEEFVCGGAFCICYICKNDADNTWFQEVYARDKVAHDRRYTEAEGLHLNPAMDMQ